ncbi:UNVERIFIED_CONTAM: hypothetical protein Slati_2383300 [Sesamum latifolium]|uniref:Uncharacterized protein n=1 Tax=Sesamum latifolium TaxID=2727402 RepID=A0AAW2WBK4_9LAMI
MVSQIVSRSIGILLGTKKNKDASVQRNLEVEAKWGHGQANATTTGKLVEGTSSGGIPGLSPEQFQKLLNILDHSSDGTKRLSGRYLKDVGWSG